MVFFVRFLNENLDVTTTTTTIPQLQHQCDNNILLNKLNVFRYMEPQYICKLLYIQYVRSSRSIYYSILQLSYTNYHFPLTFNERIFIIFCIYTTHSVVTWRPNNVCVPDEVCYVVSLDVQCRICVR